MDIFHLCFVSSMKGFNISLTLIELHYYATSLFNLHVGYILCLVIGVHLQEGLSLSIYLAEFDSE